jgi:hypothetical protein
MNLAALGAGLSKTITTARRIPHDGDGHPWAVRVTDEAHCTHEVPHGRVLERGPGQVSQRSCYGTGT